MRTMKKLSVTMMNNVGIMPMRRLMMYFVIYCVSILAMGHL